MGQRGVVGRYPSNQKKKKIFLLKKLISCFSLVHFHQLGQTDGTSVFARYNSIHKNFQRCLVIHDSNSIKVEYNVAYNITCSCFFLEDGSEINNEFHYNLGAKVYNIKSGDRQIIPSDTDSSVFWISNPKNYFTYNHASGGELF